MAERIDLIALRASAAAHSRAYSRMLEIGAGVGALAIQHPGMFQSLLDWDDATENEHSDTVLALLDIIDSLPAPALNGEKP